MLCGSVLLCSAVIELKDVFAVIKRRAYFLLPDVFAGWFRFFIRYWEGLKCLKFIWASVLIFDDVFG